MKYNIPEFANHTRWQRGFSLIELMIAITLGLLILAGMLIVFSNSSATRNEIERNNRQIENGRYAIELLRDEIQLAGFYGEIDMPKIAALALPGSLPDLCPSAAAILAELTNPAGGSPGNLRLHIQGIDNYASGLACLGTGVVKPGTDVIFIRRAKTCIAGATGCDAVANTKPYLQVPLCTKPPVTATSNTTTHALAVGGNAGEFAHRINNVDCTTSAPLRQYVINMYFVGTDNVLKRAEFIFTDASTGKGYMGNVTPLVDGIENLQLDYGVDTDSDGNADSYAGDLGDPTLAATVAKWSDVVTVQVNLLARNLEASPGYNASAATKTYSLGPSGATVTATDNIRRHVYTSLVRINNVSARREKP